VLVPRFRNFVRRLVQSITIMIIVTLVGMWLKAQPWFADFVGALISSLGW